jgi:hypothetical protein
MRKELKFIELVKNQDNGLYKIYKDESLGLTKRKIEFFAVYLDTTDNQLEFFPIDNSDLVDGYISSLDVSFYLGVQDFGSSLSRLTDSELSREDIQYNIKNRPRWK